jgi:DNA-binding Xre family transcriptional regulator
MSTARNILKNIERIAIRKKKNLNDILNEAGIPYQTFVCNRKKEKFTTEHIDKFCKALQIKPEILVKEIKNRF